MDIVADVGVLEAVLTGRANAGLPEPSFERFTPVEQKLNAPERSFTVTLARSGMTLNMSETRASQTFSTLTGYSCQRLAAQASAVLAKRASSRVKSTIGTPLSALMRSNAMKL
jgi:hypothetical protein